MEVNVNITAPAIVESMNKLAEVIGRAVTNVNAQTVQTVENALPNAVHAQQEVVQTIQPPVNAMPQNTLTAPVQPVQQAAPDLPQDIPNAVQNPPQPMQNVQPQPSPVTQPMSQQTAPTAVDPAYLNKVCNAAVRLVEQNKMPEVLALLGSFGVDAVPKLSAAQLPEFAKALTAMGAVI